MLVSCKLRRTIRGNIKSNIKYEFRLDSQPIYWEQLIPSIRLYGPDIFYAYTHVILLETMHNRVNTRKKYNEKLVKVINTRYNTKRRNNIFLRFRII